MKSNAPWSVKGIERDARETAKEAARREGLTVGEWLNQIIYSNAEDGATSSGEIEGLSLRDIVTAIEHLQKRIAESHAENADTLKDVTRKVGDVVERVQRLERVKPSEGTHEDLAARVEDLETRNNDRERIDALKALEKAVAQVAVQFNTAQKTSIQRLDATEQQLQQFAERLDHIGPAVSGDAADAGPLKKAIDELSARVASTEKIANEANTLNLQAGDSVDPGFVESTGNRLRVLGDEIKRGGDQIRTLEATISKLSRQIDAAERRSAEGVQKVAETLAELRETFSSGDVEAPKQAEIDAAVAAASRETEERITTLQASFEAMIARLDALGGETVTAPKADTPVFEDAADELIAETDEEADVTAIDEPDSDAEAQAPDNDIDAPSPAEAFGLVKPAAETQTDNEEDEDPFAFADDIDAAFDDEPVAGEPKDDFDFELDDEAEDEAPAVFGRKGVADPEPSTEEGAASSSAEDDLDQILADLDDLTGAGRIAPSGDDAGTTEEENNETLEADEADETGALSESENEDAAAIADETPARKTRRDLTPKQKAILAARARRKRLAAQQGDAPKPVDAEKLAAAKEALKASDETSDQEDNDGDEQGAIAKLLAKVSALRETLPFIGKKSGDEEPKADKTADATDKEQQDTHDYIAAQRARSGDRAAFETLKSTIAARPVTLALGVAICLSVAVLFLMVKDFIFRTPEAQLTPAEIAATPTASGAGDTAAATTDAGDALEVPAPPTVDPRILYRDAMTGLDAAETSAETAAAMTKLEEAASLGHPPAQLQLGEFYKTGQGVEQDLSQARLWFRRAANGGNVLAMHRIGVMTARGDGGPANTTEAISWFELAGNRGLVDSQYNLGAIYHPTNGGPASGVQDAGKAYYWYSLAAKNGDEQAAPLAASVAAALSADQKRALDQSIGEWKAIAADDAANELNPQD